MMPQNARTPLSEIEDFQTNMDHRKFPRKEQKRMHVRKPSQPNS